MAQRVSLTPARLALATLPLLLCACRAPASPCRACISRLERRAEIMAISDMAKKPFRMINNRMMRNSIGVSGLFVCKDNAWRV